MDLRIKPEDDTVGISTLLLGKGCGAVYCLCKLHLSNVFFSCAQQQNSYQYIMVAQHCIRIAP